MKKKTILILIAVVAIVASGVSTWFFFGRPGSAVNTEPSGETAVSGETVNENGTKTVLGDTKKATAGKTAPRTTNEERYAVVFYNTAGVPVERSVVNGGGDAALPPEPETAVGSGDMFLGWDKDFTYIFGDTDIAPSVIDISEYKNALYYNTQYAEKGKQVRVTLQLGGIVEISAFQTVIKYDSKQLKFISSENTDPAVQLKKDDDAQIKLAFMTPENTTGEVALTDLIFEVVGDIGQVSELGLNVEKAARVGSSSEDDIVTADYMVKSGKIYIYK